MSPHLRYVRPPYAADTQFGGTRVYVGTDRQTSRYAVAIAWIIPPEVIIVVVTSMASIGPVMTPPSPGLLWSPPPPGLL